MAPSFDHVVQDPVPDDISVSSKTSIVIVEGNYTLLNKDPWDKLADVFDDRWASLDGQEHNTISAYADIAIGGLWTSRRTWHTSA